MSSELKVLELYSGIGGMHCALKLSGLKNAKVIGAVDINPQANTVYKHNFKETNLIAKTIEGIKLEDFDKLNFDMILMSPPCQPFTRQGNQNGAVDPRCKSFLSLIELIPKLKNKPKYILMENVKGFDCDVSRDKFIEMLTDNKYHYQEFLLSPIQFGIPNSRLRYFLIAKLDEPFSFETSKQILTSLPEKAIPWINEFNVKCKFNLEEPIIHTINDQSENMNSESFRQVQPYQINESYLNCSQSDETKLFVQNVKTLKEFANNSMGNDSSLFLSQKQFENLMNSSDIVTLNSTRTSCFTKNYGRYMDGTGSILKICDLKSSDSKSRFLTIEHKSLRFFSPREIANLHCFPDSFEFPDEILTNQGWRLIGNSLNVFIVSILIKLMCE